MSLDLYLIRAYVRSELPLDRLVQKEKALLVVPERVDGGGVRFLTPSRVKVRRLGDDSPRTT